MASTTLKLSPMKVEVENSSDSLLACRICLATDVKLFNIREWGLDQVFVHLMGTTLSAWDGFPQHVCVFCRALLLRGQELRTRCRRAEQLLKQALMHQHFITTSFIKSIDRHAHKLTHSFIHVHDCSNRNVYNINHDDRQTDTQKPNPRWEVMVEVEDNIEMDIKDFDDDSDSKFDTDLEKIEDSLKDSVTPEDTPQVNIVESGHKTVKIERQSLKRKKEVRNKNKTERKQPARRKKKTGLNGDHPRLKPFYNQEHYKEFEDKFKFKIIALSEEEMLKEMEARKESESYKNAAFKCEFCFKGFFLSNTYENHMKTHDPARRHSCGLCGSRYFTPASLRRHTQSAHQLKFICQQCGARISSKESAELHAAFHAGATFKCDHCDLQFLKKTSRSTHMRILHPSEIAAGGTCEQCGETFLSSMGLRRHQTWSHKALPSLPNLRCRTCKLRFESQAAIDRHRDAQPGGKCDDKHSSCARCGEVCACEQDLLTHRMQQHGLQLFTCDMCGKYFESKDSVQTHMDRVHFLIKPPKPAERRPLRGASHVCEHCGKHFPALAHLRIHMNKHSVDRPYKCTLCPKTYKTLQGLKAHEPFHTGARKWRCKECDATFMHQSSLYQHRRAQIHSGEKAKAYQCHICAKTFTQSGSLQTHIKYVHMKLTPPPRKRSKKTSA